VIDLYTWPTPNGRKISIALEEFGLDYEVHGVNIGGDEQFKPEFLALSPNNKIPAIVDRDTGRSLMESGAILLYLAEKCDRFWGEDRWETIEWLMLQMGGVGPMLGQAHHFLQFNPGVAPYAETRYAREAARLYGVLERRLRVAITCPAVTRLRIWRPGRGSLATSGSASTGASIHRCEPGMCG